MTHPLIQSLGEDYKSLSQVLLEGGLQHGRIAQLLQVARYTSVTFDSFLDTTYISPPRPPNPLQSHVRQCTLGDLIHQAIAHQLQEARFRPHQANLLCLGYRNGREGRGGGTVGGISGVENYYPNTLLNYFFESSETWERLHELVGDDFVLMLLTDATIFQKVDGCESWLQIAGLPVSEKSVVEDATKIKCKTLASAKAIPRYLMFYGLPRIAAEGHFRYGLPFRHHLNKFKSKHLDSLVERIFYRGRASSLTKSARKSKMWTAMRLFCGGLVRKHQRCAYRHLFDYHCADYGRNILPESHPLARGRHQAKSQSTFDHLQSHRKVSSFVKAVMRRLFLPGERSPFMAKLIQKVKVFVSLRRYETMAIDEIVEGLPCKEFWMELVKISNYPNGGEAHQELVLKMSSFISWLFSDVLIPLIKTCFYVTETACFTNRTCYFRQDTWRRITRVPLELLRCQLLEPLSREFDPLSSWQSLGHCRLRLIPKENGFRPVMNLCRTLSRKGCSSKVSINGMLRNLHALLSYYRSSHPSCMGASIMSVGEVFPRLMDYKRAMQHESGPLFFVKFDVQACFDSIPHEKLFKVVFDLLDCDQYIIRRFEIAKLVGDRLKRRFHRIAFPSGEDGINTEGLCREGKLPGNAVIVDKVLAQKLSRTQAVKLLEDHISRNIVKIQSHYFRQKVGIPQGSMLSSLLCSLFYGHLDGACLGGFLDDPKSLFLRLIDDMIFITPCLESMRSFVDLVAKGFPEYGMLLNMRKAQANFPHPLISDVSGGSDGWFQWCGLEIHTKTLQVKSDYSRMQGQRIADGLSIDRIAPLIPTFEKYLKIYLRPKLSPLLLDAGLNGDWRHCALNIYENVLFTAMKAHAYILDLERSRGMIIKDSVLKRTYRSRWLHCRPSVDIIQRLAVYTERRVNRLSRHAHLQVGLTRALVLRGVHRVWSRRRGRYSTLVNSTSRWVGDAKGRVEGLEEKLHDAEERLLRRIRF